MAKKVTVTLVDDFDGEGSADETVEFSLDGVSYEIDLSSKNADKTSQRSQAMGRGRPPRRWPSPWPFGRFGPWPRVDRSRAERRDPGLGAPQWTQRFDARPHSGRRHRRIPRGNVTAGCQYARLRGRVRQSTFASGEASSWPLAETIRADRALVSCSAGNGHRSVFHYERTGGAPRAAAHYSGRQVQSTVRRAEELRYLRRAGNHRCSNASPTAHGASSSWLKKKPGC